MQPAKSILNGAMAVGMLLLTACHDSKVPSVIVGPPVGPSGPRVPPPFGTGQPPTVDTEPVALGDPLPGLTAAELTAFQRGKVMFEKRFKPSEGLGPNYNATSCSSCHSKPVSGGTAELYRNFYVALVNQTSNLSGLPSPVVPAYGGSPFTSPQFSLEAGRVPIPDLPGIVRVAQRNSIPIFGTGLFEFISNATIMANADPDDANGDGVSGRANNDGAGMGRFGVKAQSNNIELFTRAPLMNQMGITSNPFNGSAGTVSLDCGIAIQASSDPNSRTTDNDVVPDPEISRDDLGDLIAFTRFLAPPQPKPFDAAATRGQQQFGQLGCARCHVPELPSARGPVRAYTDLLIHEMGDDLADNVSFGRPQVTTNDPDNTQREFRTQPLWGVSHFAPYLHDGRAQTLDEAIRAHGGEALAIRTAYEALADADRADVLAFLEHL